MSSKDSNPARAFSSPFAARKIRPSSAHICPLGGPQVPPLNPVVPGTYEKWMFQKASALVSARAIISSATWYRK